VVLTILRSPPTLLAATPVAWTPLMVRDCYHSEFITAHVIDHAEGKATKRKSAPRISPLNTHFGMVAQEC
jgi:hypothetical protein